MLARYEKFLKELDLELAEYFEREKAFIKCRKGCIDCCSAGEYPMSRLEAEYLMYGFVKLDKAAKDQIRKNIAELKLAKTERGAGRQEERFLYKCPFLLDGACAVYERRGIVCRTFGLAYLRPDNTVKLPNCANLGLNYAKVFNKTTGEISLENPLKKELTIDALLKSPLAEKYELECGEIRPLIKWF